MRYVLKRGDRHSKECQTRCDAEKQDVRPVRAKDVMHLISELE
jgi:hypothetical protein